MYSMRKITRGILKHINSYCYSSQKVTDTNSKNPEKTDKSVTNKNKSNVIFSNVRNANERPAHIPLKSDKFMRRTFTKMPTVKFSTTTMLLNKVPCDPCKPKQDTPCRNETKKEYPCKIDTKKESPCKTVTKIDCPCQPKAKPSCP